MSLIEVERIQLQQDAYHLQQRVGYTQALHVIGGEGAVFCDNRVFANIRRRSIWDSLPTTVLIPPGGIAVVVTTTNIEAILFSVKVPANYHIDTRFAAEAIRPEDIEVYQIGRGTHQREVRAVVTAQHKPYQMRIGETINPPGNWSSWPVHKGEQGATDFDEWFAYFADPVDGFGVQMMGDSAHIVRAGDIMQIQQGHHPVAAGPANRLLYVWVYTSSNDFQKKYSKWADEAVGLYAV